MVLDVKIKCQICKDFLGPDEFSPSETHTRVSGKITKSGRCRTCKTKKDRENRRATPDAIVRRLYQHQKSRKDKWKRPSYSCSELQNWALVSERQTFDRLFKVYRDSGYKSELRPSIDRINPLEPYQFGNLQLMTWEENFEKRFHDKIVIKNHREKEEVPF